jgi:hypothetical protein
MLPVFQTPTPQDLLRMARLAEQQRQPKRAIELLRDAYARIERSGDIYNAEVFTRLACVLQSVGRSAEGWQHLRELISQGCPGRNRYCHPATRWLDQAVIYDKMRLFQHRAGQYDGAVLSGVWFYYCRYQACVAQPKLAKTGSLTATRTIESLLKPLLRKAGKEQLLYTIVAEMKSAIREPQLANWVFLQRRVRGYLAAVAGTPIDESTSVPPPVGASSAHSLQQRAR